MDDYTSEICDFVTQKVANSNFKTSNENLGTSTLFLNTLFTSQGVAVGHHDIDAARAEVAVLLVGAHRLAILPAAVALVS